MNREMKNVVFILGAGVEYSSSGLIKMPLGDTFSYKTIFNAEHDKMGSALKKFYRNRKDGDKYKTNYPYDHTSRMFHTCVRRMLEDPEINERLSFMDLDFSDKNKNNTYKKLYSYLSSAEHVTDINILVFSGGIEQYFSTIVDSECVEKQRFWRLINYFWNSFFTILMPYTDYIFKDIPEYNKNSKYSYIIDHIDEILLFKNLKSHIDEYHRIFAYYEQLYELNKELKSKSISILTTNYMPFAEILTDIRTVYLSGKITEFEDNGLSIKEYHEFDCSELIFPYILTQAPIKPIINGRQIKNLSSAIETLDKADQVYILGYSIPINDMHILSMIRDYITKNQEHELYYYDYMREAESIKEDDNSFLCEKLRLSCKEMTERIHVYKHSGNENSVFLHIRKRMKMGF